VRVADHEDRLSERTRCLLRTTSAYHLLPNTIQIETKPTFSPTAVPPPMRTSVTYSKQNLPILYPVPTLSHLPKGTDKDMLMPLSFFFFPVQVSRHWVLSCWPRRTPSLSVKGGGSKGDTPMPHRSLLYRAQDSSWQVAHQSPPVDGETRLDHHSRPHAGSLGTTRSSDLREMICVLRPNTSGVRV